MKKKSAPTRKPFAFRPQLLPLEDRAVPAGNITVGVFNGVLTIRSDDDVHAFDISGCTSRSVIIRPSIGTTINGQSEAQWFGNITRGYDIQTGNGADSIVINNVDAHDYLSIVTNGGDDVVHIVNGTRSPDSTWVRTGDGNDLVVINGIDSSDHFAFVGGNGDDRAIVQNSRFGRQTSFDGGAGNDSSLFTNTNFSRPINFESTDDGNLDTSPPAAIAPTVTLSSTSAATTKDNPIPFTATFTESVTGFDLSDLTITNGTASNLTAVSGTLYTFSVTPTANGAVTVTVKANAATNAAGTGNFQSAAFTRTFDTTAPTVTPASLRTNDTTPTLTGTVSETVSSVNVTVNGQTVAATINGTNWTATLTNALAAGTYTISATATDSVGNIGNGSKADGLVIDLTAPTATLDTSADAVTGVSPIPYTVNFSENVQTFAATGLTVTNGTVANFTKVSATNYTFNVVPATDGQVSVFVNAGATLDEAGNAVTQSNTVAVTFNGSSPTVTFTSTVSGPTNSNSIPVTANFSENVGTVTQDMIVVENATIANFTMVNSKQFTFNLIPSNDGDISVRMEADQVQDTDGRGNLASEALVIVSDRTAPEGTLASSSTLAIAGTALDTGGSVAKVEVSIFNGTSYWNGTAFAADEETFLNATTSNSFANWSYAHNVFGTYTVRAKITDAAGNENIVDGSASNVPDLTSDSGMVNSLPDVNAAAWQTLDNGMKVWDVQVGTGSAVTTGQNVTIYYTGWLLNGTQFDARRSPNPAITFDLDFLIEGWKIGIPGMQPGGIRRLYIPPELAYGSQPNGSIPANSTLVFEIKLISSS